MEKVKVPASPGRLINAVASMGYDPEVALCDLIDNSIDATATKIKVDIIKEAGKSESEAIQNYTIYDNGLGMDRDQLINAFTLGSERNYPKHSLGKFGMGLKSAGLSLGQRIVIVSKTKQDDPLCAVLSVSDIEDSGEYRIDLGSPSAEYQSKWDNYSTSDQGTLLIIERPNNNRPHYSAFSAYLSRYCSNVYHMILEDKERNLSIYINGSKIVPIDPLFMSIAKGNGALLNPTGWEGKTPHVLIADQNLKLDKNANCQIAATHLIHPPSFEDEGKRIQMRDNFQIETDPFTKRPRHGFYIYRNKRIIVMAELFRGMISRQNQAWAFRGRLQFDESADKALSLDVKKRHCQLPKGARNTLVNIISSYQKKSIEAWIHAGRSHTAEKKKDRMDIANSNINSTPVSKLDYSPSDNPSSSDEVDKRVELQSKVSSSTLNDIQDKNISAELLNKYAHDNNVVVMVEGLKGNMMWAPYAAQEIGKAETIVNKAHSWVSEAYSASEAHPHIAIILHHLFTILARGELEVKSTPWSDMPDHVITTVFDRYRRKVSAIGEDLAEALEKEIERSKRDE